MGDKHSIRKMALALGISAMLLGGCSRQNINYQVAEAIGTVGMYENNEPVETPKMVMERELREQQESERAAFEAQLAHAEDLAEGYWYTEAIEYLSGLDTAKEEVQELLTTYQSKMDSMVKYTGDVAHLCFPTLIEDPLRAFDGDEYSSTYASTMITTEEFKRILQSLYDNNYILVDLHSVAALDTDSRGVTTMEMKDLYLPEGKKPVILSQDNLDYSGVRNGDGIAKKLVLDDAGSVQALYTDDGGHDLKGAYDFIPILNAFLEEHPDFTFQGAKGIVSVSGSEGVFGYDIGTGNELSETQKTNRETVAKICKALTDSGWSLACAGYTHTYLNGLSTAQLQSEISSWEENVKILTGSVDILFYPYGAEVAYDNRDQVNTLLGSKLVYLCGLWGDTDFMELGDNYLRQTRRFIDGYTLVNATSYFTDFFDAASVISSDR